MTLEVVSAALASGVAGVWLVGPWLARAVQRWIGWRVVLPLLLGWVPAWPAVKERPPRGGWAGPPYRGPVRMATGVAFAVVGLRLGWSIALLPVLSLVCGLVAIATVDLVCWRIPSRFVYVTGAAVLAGAAIGAVVAGEPRSLQGAAVGAAAYLVFLGGMHLVSPRLLGFGDVRLGGLIGLGVGWMGWDATFPVSQPLSWALFSMVVASLAALAAGLVVLAVRRRQRRLSGRVWREPFPYGPWLCLGALVAILAAAPGPVG
jgi:leader peptidase (prepilin peptidase)/N-methyltransferase